MPPARLTGVRRRPTTSSYVGGTATFDNKNVGTAKTVTVTGITLSGADAGNYTLNSTATTTADITARDRDRRSVTADNKVYDGTTAATRHPLAHRRRRRRRREPDSGTATFANKNVGTGKTVTRQRHQPERHRRRQLHAAARRATTTADITARALTVSATGNNKVYDGTTAPPSPWPTTGSSATTCHRELHRRHFDDQERRHRPRRSASPASRISGTDAGNYTWPTPRPRPRPTSRRVTLTVIAPPA